VKTIDGIVENRIKTLLPLLDEKQKRIYLATEAEGLGQGGLKAVHELTYETIQQELEKIIGNDTLGNPEKVILWTTKSVRDLEKALRGKGFTISHGTVGNVLKGKGYSLQQNQKMLQVGVPHQDRNAQFEYM
jgi:hypothetical protein